MTARAIWKGILTLGPVTVPVKFYSALEDRKIHFRILHEKDLVPVIQEMVNPRTNEPVPREETLHGYVETEEDKIIILKDEEIKELEPSPSREVRIMGFLDPGHIGHQWYDRPYYLGPDNSQPAYASLARALEKSGKMGFARWTMRKKSYIGVLGVRAGYLIMITLRFSREVIDAAELPRPRGRPLEKQEIRMAEQLIGALEGDFHPADYQDEYRERVMELIEKKSRGETVRFQKPKKRKADVISLTDTLRKSIRKAREERKVA